MRIDVHAHYWTDDYLDLVAGLGKTDTATQRGTGAGGGAELDARLRLMDRAGVDMQVLSAAPQLPYGTEPQQALAAARFVNDQYADLVSKYPDRFRAFAGAGRTGHDRGGHEHDRPGPGAGRSPVRAGLRRTQPAQGRAVPASGREFRVHAADQGLQPDLGDRCAGRGHHLRHAADHPRDPIPSRYPDVKIINSHLGGALPMLPQRADNQYLWANPDTPELPSVAARRMWYDTVGHGLGRHLVSPSGYERTWDPRRPLL